MENVIASTGQDRVRLMPVRSLVWAALLLFLALPGGVTLAAETDASSPPTFQMPKSGVRSGHITAKQENSVEINGTRYAFHPKVEFWTDEGHQLEWSDFNRGNEVQFHLKLERVDFLVLVQPK